MTVPPKAKVLFLCTGNSARSQMAEAFLRKYAGDYFEVHSAGMEPKAINPLTVRVMAEARVDMSGHRSKGVREYLGRVNFGYLITVCADAEENCPVAFLGVSKREFWKFDDPALAGGTDAEKLAVFRDVRDQISARIKAWLDEIKIPIEGANAPESA
jgi:arsenate reductase (thioredoxin)